MKTIKELAVKHTYYCSDNSSEIYSNWKNFLEDFENYDQDLNLIFRWDIIKGEDDDDDTYSMLIFVVLQRKGRIQSFLIEEVTDNDVESIETFLKIRFNHLVDLWNPIK